jgi:hypothetical protein
MSRNNVWMRRSVVLAFVGVTVLLVTTAASGAVQPVSPGFGAKTGSRPTFTWDLGNQLAIGLYIASQATLQPSGEFDPKVVEQQASLKSRQSRWTDSRALFAGRHWWNVSSHSPDTLEFSEPWPFEVRAEIQVSGIRTVWSGRDRLGVTVGWTTNEREVVIQALVRRGRHRVGSAPYVERTTRVALKPDGASLTWRRPRAVRSGTRLTLVLSVRGPGAVRTVRRALRAP